MPWMEYFERFLQHDRAGVGHQSEQRVLAAETPEQRHGKPQAILLRNAEPLAYAPGVLDQTGMLDGHTLGHR